MNSKPIQIYDTTLRDGSQGEGVSFSLQDKLNIARRLAESGINFIEGGYPLSNEKDVAFFEQIRQYDLGEAQVCAFGMTRRKSMKAEADPGMQALVQAKTPCITLVGKTWDYHATEVLRVTLDENVDMIGESSEFLSQHAKLIYDAEHFFDGFHANPEYAIKTLVAAASAGAKWLVLCDTNGGTLPERIAEVTKTVVSELSDYDTSVGIHTHNDGELAVANSLAAVDAGALQVQGTINGIGERCGNADLISVISNLALKKSGYEVLGGKPLTHLTELSRYVYETANLQWRNGQAFVGQSAFAHKGGMHVSAVQKDPKTYEHINPEEVGNSRNIIVSDQSGQSNIMSRLNSIGIKVEKSDPKIKKLLEEVKDREFIGFSYDGADASFELLARRLMGEIPRYISINEYDVSVKKDNSGEIVSYAKAQLEVDGHKILCEGQGNGPVNALDNAIRKNVNKLAKYSEYLKDLRLVDYKVRILNTGTEAVTRVSIESTDSKGINWFTIGVSPNIIDASFKALVDSLDYKLFKDKAPGSL